VINVASLLAFSGSWEVPHVPARAVYAASKSFLVTFTQILANELRGSGVRMQVVCPGVVRSEFHSRQLPGSDDETAIEAVDAAQRELMGATRTVELPERYATK